MITLSTVCVCTTPDGAKGFNELLEFVLQSVCREVLEETECATGLSTAVGLLGVNTQLIV